MGSVVVPCGSPLGGSGSSLMHLAPMPAKRMMVAGPGRLSATLKMRTPDKVLLAAGLLGFPWDIFFLLIYSGVFAILEDCTWLESCFYLSYEDFNTPLPFLNFAFRHLPELVSWILSPSR